ncbi:MAG: hypothetical protein ACSLFK_01165 [Gemmatimonadaceae bacterium]
MKKLFFLPLAAFVFAACSENTAPDTNADLSPSYAKPVKNPPATGGATGSKYSATFDFDAPGIQASNFSTFATDTDDNSVASSSQEVQYVPNDAGNGFFGRFNNTNTRALLVMTEAGSKYTVNFDLYVIGSWDGRGKQAQQGIFEANAFQVGWRCSPTGAITTIFETSFSNQYTVQQDFPNYLYTGGYKAGTGSVPGSIDALGYADRPDLSHTPSFRSFGDATYALQYTIGNVCNGQPPTFVFGSTAPGQQNNYDESWGIDNVILKVDI